MCETTALGVAIAAGSAEGIRKWDVKIDAAVPSDIFLPAITENGDYLTMIMLYYKYKNFVALTEGLIDNILISERDILYSQWKMGIDRSLGWEILPEINGNY